MDQYTDSQYDDDLTIGADEYDESFQTSDVDLFEFGGEEDSPISRLKTLVLSIDWEITDEVLLQFNDELLDLKDVWAADKVRMVYLQALQKIGKYIQRQKADSHPNAIKLLLSMYYNLERIVLSHDLSADEKKKILIEDVRKFERLKKQIGKEPQVAGAAGKKAESSHADEVEAPPAIAEAKELLDLKAIVLGIDWEITEKDLIELREEVVRLEAEYSDSRPRLVFLQGIGTLGAYIRKKKSNAHADAFKLLHSFYEGLEKLVQTPMITLEQEKAILLPEVEKFNIFKSLIAKSLTQVELEPVDSTEPEDEYGDIENIAPAFADMPEDAVHGFQEEVEAAALGVESPVSVNAHIDKFFGEDDTVDSAPAEEIAIEPEPELPVASVDESVNKEAEEFSSAFFDGGEEATPVEVDRETALKGVDVETEADDDSDEEALPFEEGEVAPALADSDVTSAFSVGALGNNEPEGEVSDEITGRLDDFFDQKEPGEVEPAFGVDAEVALQGVNVESEGDEDEESVTAELKEAEDSLDFDEIAPAFADIDDDFELPDDLLSDTELPMEPAEFDEPRQELSSADTLTEDEETLDAQAEATALEADLSAFDEVDFKDVVEPVAEDEATGGAELPPELDFDEFEDIPAALSDEDIPAQKEAADEQDTAESAVEDRFDEMFGTSVDEDVLEIDEPVGETESESEFEDQVDQFFSLEDDTEEDVTEQDAVTDTGSVAEEFTVSETPVPEAPVEEAAADEISGDDLSLRDEPDSEIDEAEGLAIPPSVEFEPVEEEEEDVFFELAEDEEDIAELPAVEDTLEEEPPADLMDKALAAGAGVAAGIAGKSIVDDLFEESEDAPVAPVAEPAEEDTFDAVFTAAEEDVVEEPLEFVDELAEESPVETTPAVDSLADLKGCVQSVGLELDDAIIAGLFAEIQALRQQWVDRPVEKTYLQLLSTVAQHIDQYRYNANDESHTLLGNLLDDLEECQNQDDSKAQENLLSNTCKVLQWQQGMLNTLAVRGEDGYLAFTGAEAVEPVLDSDEEPVQEEDLISLDEEPQVLEIEEPAAEEIEETPVSIPVSVEDKDFSVIVRREIESLRETLKREIAELKKALHSGSDKD